MKEMRCASALSRRAETPEAFRELAATAAAQVAPGDADLVLLFVSEQHVADLAAEVLRLREAFPGAAVAGCTAEGVIGGGEEVEKGPSAVLFCASLPGAEVHPFLLRYEEMQSDPEWMTRIGVEPGRGDAVLAFADPQTFPVPAFLETFNETHPGTPIIGGLASGGRAAPGNRLILGHEVFEDGIVGLRIGGSVRIDTVVSQGCRPVGRTFIVTKGEGNVIRSLASRSTLSVLQEMLGGLDEADQRLLRQGLFVGRAIDEYKSGLGRGDFLIQSVVGADPETGAIAIAGEARTGTTVQFHVRDRMAADEDLRELLRLQRERLEGKAPAGALVFSCNGRGTRMWPEPGHDVGCVHDHYGDVAAGGFFCAGEIGPVGGLNFLHGFTASIGLIVPA